MTKGSTYRLGVDIGGTFTDIVLVSDTGAVVTRKTPSTPNNYADAIVDGVSALLADEGIPASAVEYVVHGTTIASNAILENNGAVTALVTTAGFRDVLELRRLRRPELYNMRYRPPRPLVPRQLRFEVTERVGPRGEVSIALDERSIASVRDSLANAKCAAVAICLLHSYANPSHERELARRLREALPDTVYLSCSSDLLREAREYERTSTTVVNAFLGPSIQGYLLSLIERLDAIGFKPSLQLMQSNGALIPADVVIKRPASIIESGPAAGVIGAAKLAALSGYANVISFDMGGTTAKAALVENGTPAMTSDYEVGAGINLSSKLVKGAGHAVRLPFVDISEIGAGGGSIVWFDQAGHLHVGPQSAGSDPGPICYGRGGTQPTLTDAFVVLGHLDSRSLVGGALQLDADAARESLEVVARRLGQPLLEACFGICQLAASTMVRAVKAVTTYRGRDPREFVLVAFGGNGPVVASAIATVLGMSRVLIPPSPGVFSAAGLLSATPGQEFTRSCHGLVEELHAADIIRVYVELEAEARRALQREGHLSEMIEVRRLADLRYSGQAYELTIPVEASLESIGQLATAFGEEHLRTYGHRADRDPVELVNLRVFAEVKTGAMRIEAMRNARSIDAGELGGGHRRNVYFGPEHGLVDTPVISRSELKAKATHGPLIIREYDSTCVIPPGCDANLDHWGNIAITLPSGGQGLNS